MRRHLDRPGIPIFFKLWFAFIFLVAISIVGGFVYVAAAALQAGPEGIGRAIGSVIKGIDDGRR